MRDVGGQQEVVIVDAVRTAIGRGHPEKGMYRGTHANELLGTCFTAVLQRTGIPGDFVQEVVAGCVEQYGEQSINVARNAWLQAGLPVTVPAATIDRQCGSGQQAVTVVAAMIRSGLIDVGIAGGVEHMGHVPMSLEGALLDRAGDPWPRSLRDRHDLVPQGEAAELVADRWDIGRAEMDELSVRSHALADSAHRSGLFKRHLVSVPDVEETVDQGVRPDAALDTLGALRPVFREGGRVTAGNSSQISDGASALLLMSRRRADELSIAPLARVVDAVAVGVDPVLMLEGPVPATQLLLARNGLRSSDVQRFEINEAFASVLGMWLRELPDVELARVNPNGGAIAMGHPLGASGARLLTDLTHELVRTGAHRGIVAMCCRGGVGTGTLLELAS